MAARKRSRFWLWSTLGGLVAVVVLVAAVVAHSSGTQIEGSRLGNVTRMDIAKSVVATGKVQPITKVEVKSKASGIVEKWYVDANARVHRGQVLAQVEGNLARGDVPLRLTNAVYRGERRSAR